MRKIRKRSLSVFGYFQARAEVHRLIAEFIGPYIRSLAGKAVGYGRQFHAFINKGRGLPRAEIELRYFFPFWVYRRDLHKVGTV